MRVPVLDTNYITGGRVTQTAKVEDCTILTRIAGRTEWYAGNRQTAFLPGLKDRGLLPET
ncbi:MAG TPA: hypothetical protein PKK74_04395 [Candidatus Methanoculleus thermohydrogenotrophicum]|jgi:hypothetical protein|nr:hypothetical protein [Candidatus Methanoculleus thermohydrogenotrophicum]NLM82860.1 hypothetical protein [Candidatus Methanoculleus thermohydrogenotrophicum]HOB17917.1 hypothetical protein [Candidatus Methanoculleus thermohydrogenotrophicum]HPZ38052.1 hypothetical protein [Candidatus Methanoculleus thermohydrogenotrophicum]HQC91304.1 hypothetical protein [Candidatus Methanoculleus thermohydrogenotrophicum]